MSVRPDIAIVGLGCAFPGALDPHQFWSLISGATCVARHPPPGRWPQDSAQYCAPNLVADRIVSARACFVDPLPESPELELPGIDTTGLDPLFHLLLHAGRQAWNDAVTEHLDRAKCGVLLGQIVLPTQTLSNWSDDLLARATQAVWGSPVEPAPRFNPLNRHIAGLPGGLLAAALELGGGASCLDAACASSLYALKLAVDELTEGRRDAMLVGGLSRPDSLYTQMGFSHLHALSPSGYCRPFSRDADGLLVGEGAGVVVLKRLADALDSGDHIYATLPGIGLSNDIGGNLMHPDTEGQLRAMYQAYAQAGWQPDEVDLIECHGTGTVTGDRVELTSLQHLWSAVSTTDAPACVIGSVKSNIGHLLTAAGIAGLIKVLLSMQEKQLPPSANVTHPLPDLHAPGSPFRLLDQVESWPLRAAAIPRRAAVSAFGFGGINAHVLLEEWDPARRRPNSMPKQAQPRQTAPVRPEPIAVVGLAGQFGPWTDPTQLTVRLLGDPQAQSPALASRRLGLAGEDAYRGYPLKEICIDRLRFRIPPKELAQLLPQQALMLQIAADALDDAQISTDHGAHSASAIYIGLELDMNTCNYHWRWQSEKRCKEWQNDSTLNLTGNPEVEFISDLQGAATGYLNADRTMGALGGIVASRIARWLGAGAGSFTVSCEQASAIKAMEIAIRALRRREINLAVVGGVDLNAEPRALQAQKKLQNGDVFGEGAGAMVLKRHSDALRDGDRIYCLLRGVGQHAASPSSPQSDSSQYQLCLDEVLRDAGMASVHPDLIEVSGVQDRTAPAVLALQSVLLKRSARLKMSPPVVSLSTTMLGDCGAASGMAGMLRVATCLYYRVLPTSSATGNVRQSRQSANGAEPRQPHYWLRNRAQGPRQALLSVESLLGENLQVIAEEVELHAPPPDLDISTLLCIHGVQTAGLVAAIEDCQKQFVRSPGTLPAAIIDQWHQQNIRETQALTVSVVAKDHLEFIALLDEARTCVEAALRPQSTGLYYEPVPLAANKSALAFVFPGSGNHYAGMSQQLSLPAAAVLDRNDARNQNLRDQFAGGAFWRDLPVDNQDHPTLLCAQIWSSTFVHDIFYHLGIRPGSMIGYSLGETASLFASGCWPDRDSMLTRIRNSDLFTRQLGAGFAAVRQHWGLDDTQPVDWQVAMLQAPVEQVRTVLADSFAQERIYLLIVNTARECVVGGDGATLRRFASALGVALHPVAGVTSVHCEVVRSVAQEYRTLHLQQTRNVPDISHYSCHLGRTYKVDSDAAADSILGMALAPFDFSKLIETAYADGVRLFVETGPGDACTRMIDQILMDRPHLACSASHSRTHEYTSLLQAVAQVAAHGVVFDSAHWQQHNPVPDHRLQPQQTLTLEPGLSAWQVPPRPTDTEQPRPLGTMTHTAAPATPAASNDPWPAPMVHGMLAMLESRHQAHQTYLNLQTNIEHSLSEAAQQLSLASAAVQPPLTAATTDLETPQEIPQDTQSLVFDRAACLRFAVGGIAEVLGAEFSDIDQYPVRVRLPDEPLMLVDRITAIEGQAGTLGPARIVTEHDILPAAWYLDGDRIPTCIAVEAGQADLFLSAWLGIDRVTRGTAVYRLLDANITFHDHLPGPGVRIVYDIRIKQFFTLGKTHLFKFEFDASIEGKPLLSMRDGSAGFFTPDELTAGQGIVKHRMASAPGTGALDNTQADWLGPALNAPEQYSDQQLDALRRGDLGACFGDDFNILPIADPQTLPTGRLRLVHRILDIQPPQGAQPGRITGEADIHPQDWFLTCHFIDDQVMPGTLMYECCLHTLRIYLLRMGWVGAKTELSYQPVPGYSGKLKCRGQVIAATQTVQYQINVLKTDFLADGTPYAIADALMLADGQPIVEMQNMSLCLRGLHRQRMEEYWQLVPPIPPVTRAAVFDQDSILAYAQGHPSDAFGERYRIFDTDRIIARLPRPPYLFLDQIERIEHCEPWQLSAGGEIESSYQIKSQDWYFEANRQHSMPLAILLEIALQPCGWLAAYLGSALSSETDLSFRNLDGHGTLHRPMNQHSGRIQALTKIDKVSRSGGMIIQNYSVALHDSIGLLYDCETVFGFFSKSALAQQVGIREAQWYTLGNLAGNLPEQLPHPTHVPLPGDGLRMLDKISVLSLTGGRHGLGWVEGHAQVDINAWYFNAHFYQDPVIPGSLGIESMVQLLKVYALERWTHLKHNLELADLFQCPAPGVEMRWTYRGQVVPDNDRVSVQIHLLRVDSTHLILIADGYLAVDGRIIYSVENMSLSVRGGT